MFEILYSLIMVFLILVMTYVATKWLGKRMAFQSRSRYIEVIDKVYLDRDKMIAIVRIQDHYQAIAMSSNAISNLGTLDTFTPMSNTEEAVGEAPAFASFLQKVMPQKKNKATDRDYDHE